MSTEVITCGLHDDLTPVANCMLREHIRHLPVLEEGELAGIVSIRDILTAQRDDCFGEVETLQFQVSA